VAAAAAAAAAAAPRRWQQQHSPLLPAAAAAAPCHPQQPLQQQPRHPHHRQLQQQQQQQQVPARQVVARVRLDDIDGNGGGDVAAPLAAEALQEYMQLEQSGNFNATTAQNLRCVGVGCVWSRRCGCVTAARPTRAPHNARSKHPQSAAPPPPPPHTHTHAHHAAG
jgi:hypothetical protein